MKQRANKCVLILICLAIIAGLFTGQAFAVKYYHISRPRLGFELDYELDNDKRSGPFVNRDDTTTTYTERLDIETDGWFYHPALVEYILTLSPEWQQVYEESKDWDTRITRTFLQGYDTEFTFLQYKPYTLTLFGNRSMSTIKHNFAQKSKIDSTNYGARLNLKYQFLPTILSVARYEDEQSGFYDLTTTRNETRLNMKHSRYMGDTSLEMLYIDVVDTSIYLDSHLISKEASLLNIYKFSGEKATLTSFVGFRDKTTNTYLEKGVNGYENLMLRHKRNLSTNYNFYYESFDLTDNRRRLYESFDFTLNHLLYENLTTTLSADSSKNQNYEGQERVYGGGLDWNYVRRIPGGSINAVISHSYHQYDKQPNFYAISVPVQNELKVLSGNSLVFLNNIKIETSTIKVIEKTKPNGLRGKIFIEGIDYTITVIGDSTGISRKPGTSTIPDGDEVFIDYRYVPAPPFDYEYFNRSYGVTLNLFKSLKMFYRFSRSKQKFLRGIEPDSLWAYLSHTVRLDYEWKWSRTSLEYTDVSSTQTPLESWKVMETLLFRPAKTMHLNLMASVGETRFKELDKGNDTDRYQNYKANLQTKLSPRRMLSFETFFNKISGVVNRTQDAGFSSIFEWKYNIYNGFVNYTYSNEKNLSSRETFINHIFMIKIKRELF